MTASTCATKRRALYAWLVRGALGLALLAVAIVTREPLVAIPAILGALIAFRGCPMCWVFNFAAFARKDES